MKTISCVVAALCAASLLTGCLWTAGGGSALEGNGIVATVGTVAETGSTILDTATNIASVANIVVADLGGAAKAIADATAQPTNAPPNKILLIVNKGATVTASGLTTAEKWIGYGLKAAKPVSKVFNWLAAKLK